MTDPTKTWMPRWAALLGVLALACVASRSGESQPEAPGSRIGFSRPPVVDGGRTACTQPPYAPAEGATALADGMPVRRDGDAPEWTVLVRDGREPTPSESAALVERFRGHADLRFFSHGLYCDAHTRTCFSLAANLCEATVQDLVSRVQAALDDEPDFAELRVELHVTLAGRIGPRCAAEDPACLPEPYESGTAYDPRRPRRAGPMPHYSGGECTHDGHCVRSGCGNHCISWEYGGANEGATCEGYMLAQPTFCGCVEQRCAWFTQ